MDSPLRDRENRPNRSYLMLINIPTPKPEHAKLQDVFKSLHPQSKAVFFNKNAVAFLFNTDLYPNEIRNRFDGTLLSGDTFLLVEVGRNWETNTIVASGWLQTWLQK